MTIKAVTAIHVDMFQNEDARRHLVELLREALPMGGDRYLSIRYGWDQNPSIIAVWAEAKPRKRG